ncbi:adenine-specific DNA-methyltransferase [Limnobaculum parvum]|uniref:Site-specific DNA-methyltransferase (adenine-specific) n=1 Tax=Limnobaculum parvum TaxID=2172103 RepID=A0A2Y9TXV5_9GAMM|nr:adenine-specific DNA-methyltransferase [Limnobaculum parvum]AWH88563.1 adenine-specific DNA-methyltransferase [Limnobaculum parvum]
MKKNRSFLKWAGGKYPLVDEIREHLPRGKCLIEPFVGAGSVFLNTDYDKYILADINSDLINLYEIVKACAKQVVKDARELFNDEHNQEVVYYELRREFNQSRDRYRRALLFIYLNRHCYNGLCRYNLSGEFNVPFGRYKRPYFPEAEIYFFAEKAKRATFFCENYEQTMMKASSGAVVYCDPPYAPLSATANFTAYHTNNFNLKDQQHLALLARDVAGNLGVPVLISNHATELTREWYKEAQLVVVRGRRTISRNVAGRTKVDELLALYRPS